MSIPLSLSIPGSLPGVKPTETCPGSVHRLRAVDTRAVTDLLPESLQVQVASTRSLPSAGHYAAAFSYLSGGRELVPTALEFVLGAIGKPNPGIDIGRQVDVEGEAAVLVLPPGDRDWSLRGCD